MSKIKVIPCSGIGKALGLISRETVLQVTNNLSKDEAETVCLAHVVTGDKDAVDKVKNQICITVDGCPALCAAKSVEHAGGIIKAKYRVVDEMKKHRGKDAGTGTTLTDAGWQIVDEFAEEISKHVTQLSKEGSNHE